MTFLKGLSSLSIPGRSMLLAFNDVFFFLLGGSAWILVNGIYAQLPFIILMFDGDYGVASKITLCITISSLIPIVFSVSFFESLSRSDDKNIKRIKRPFGGTTDSSSHTTNNQNWYINSGITLILCIALIASIALAIWTEWITSQLGPLMATVTAGGIVGTTSSILYYPHAATTAIADDTEADSSTASSNIAKRQTTAMLFGTATSNLFVAILAILQQEKLEHQFNDRLATRTVRNYFAVLMIVITLSATGFVGTLLIRRTMKQNAASKISKYDDDDHTTLINEASSLLESQPMDLTKEDVVIDQHILQKPSHESSSSFWRMTYLNSTLNAAQFILNALTFFLPGIVPYSVRNQHDDEGNKSSNALQYLIVFQLVAHTLGVLASSRGGNRSTSGETTRKIVQCQLGSFFLFLWIPMVFFSLSREKRFGVTIPIVWNTLLNFTYAYCNTSWFHFSVNHHNHKGDQGYHSIRDNAKDTIISVNEESSDSMSIKNIESVSTTSAVRIMGTWHQIGATFGSAIAFAMIQSAAILSTN